MKIYQACLLLGLAFAPHTLARHELPAIRGLRRRAQDNILDAGIGAVRSICDPAVSECASADMHMKVDIGTSLLAKSLGTGEIFCFQAGHAAHGPCSRESDCSTGALCFKNVLPVAVVIPGT